MKRLSVLLLLAMTGMFMLTACGKEKKKAETPVATETDDSSIVIGGDDTSSEAVETTEEAAEEEVEEAPEGMYASETTGEWIDISLKDQRPIAVMIDDEKKALPHYGVSDVDVLYEMVNSTQNEGVTRFMAIIKDWGKITQLGSIRSTRPTNLQIFPEWNAVLCHDGGPFWNDNFYKNKFVERFSGTFSRVNNGKPREFTEYVCKGDLEKNFKNTGYSTTYNEYWEGTPHYQFASHTKDNDLSQYSSAVDCKKLVLPFHHNNPYMEYDEAEGVYKYFQYGQKEVDAGNGNKQVAFKNVLLQNARLEQLDSHGYMMYYPTESGREGYYITDGKAIKVTWSKLSDITATRYYDEDGNEIKINVGKTYVGLISDKEWGNIEIN
ncbi:MAG: DUF3048 domain-containing protein [Lachnospiraceae bacterium]|nr:DUF3048 domain-containing protein [Lachnospiraceae bacterium]